MQLLKFSCNAFILHGSFIVQPVMTAALDTATNKLRNPSDCILPISVTFIVTKSN